MNQLDLLWSKVVRLEMGLCCLFCGRLGQDAHHVLSRAQYPAVAVKYEPDFGVWLCRFCHSLADHNFDLTIQTLRTRYPERAARILGHLNSPFEMSRSTAADQRAYLRWRLRHAERNWMDLEVDACRASARLY